MITVDGRAIGLIALADILDRPSETNPRYVMVLAASDRRAAFLVDDLITEQEMVVKNLNPELARLRYGSDHPTDIAICARDIALYHEAVRECARRAQARP